MFFVTSFGSIISLQAAGSKASQLSLIRRMKDADGHGISIAQVNQMPRDMMAVQMNVRDFDEAVELLKLHGFRNKRVNGDVIDTGLPKQP